VQNQATRGPVPEASEATNRVLKASFQHFHAWQMDCSGYVKAVARELGVPIHQGMANGIVDSLAKGEGGWQRLGSLEEAQAAANRGNFVVVGLENPEHGVGELPHGHLAIILPGGPTPVVACGSMTPGGARHPWVQGTPPVIPWNATVHGWLVFGGMRITGSLGFPPTGAFPPGAGAPPAAGSPPGSASPPSGTTPPSSMTPPNDKAQKATARWQSVGKGLEACGYRGTRAGLAQYNTARGRTRDRHAPDYLRAETFAELKAAAASRRA
jgi:hypothetical protein